MEKKKEHPAVLKALAIMAKNKKRREAGIPPGQDNSSAAYGSDNSSSGRSMIEAQNKDLAEGYAKAFSETDPVKRKAMQEELNKKAEDIKKYKGK